MRVLGRKRDCGVGAGGNWLVHPVSLTQLIIEVTAEGEGVGGRIGHLIIVERDGGIYEGEAGAIPDAE